MAAGGGIQIGPHARLLQIPHKTVNLLIKEILRFIGKLVDRLTVLIVAVELIEIEIREVLLFDFSE